MDIKNETLQAGKKKEFTEENTTYAFWDTSSNCFKGLRNEIVLAHGQGILN